MRRWGCRIVIRIAALCALAGAGAGVQAAVIGPELAAELAARGPHDEISVIVSLADKVDPRSYEVRDRSVRDTRLVRALMQKAAATQGPYRVFLQNNGARSVRELWVINGMAVTAPVSTIRRLASLAGIERITLDSTLQEPVIRAGDAAPPEWNLSAVQAPQVWALGHAGSGVVVANMDTGVDAAHPDLAARWRGGGNSWYDPHGQHVAPYDRSGHGTQTIGLMVGGAAGGTAIGMAPDAQWIAVKLYDDSGQARYSDIHLSFQWLLDPDGDLATLDAPDVVNASWGLIGTAGQCITEFSADIEMLKAAGIAIAWAAGNDGPSAMTSLSPANNAQGFSVGAVDSTLAVASFSSRGPSACDGAVYPKLAAPGVSINTSDLSFGGLPQYMVVSGSSYAAPHVAGAMALLAGAFPGASVAQLEAALTATAEDRGASGADNDYGHGLIDVQAAYDFLKAGMNSPPAITSTPPITAAAGSPYLYAVAASDPDGDAMGFALDLAPAGMTVDAASGRVQWTPTLQQAGSHDVTVRVTDARGQYATQSFSVNVAAPNQAPVASADAYTMASGSTLNIAAPGLLANDSDADGNALVAVLATALASGSLVLNADGSFSYSPNSGFVGTDSFAYRAFDGALYSADAKVTVTVNGNQPPVAANDAASAPMRKSASYVPVVIKVLANDSDPDGALDAASVTIASEPNKGGTVTVNADGTVSYAPKLKYRGTETFTYRVRDQLGGQSNFATVNVTVR